MKISESDKEKTLEILREIEKFESLDENGEAFACPNCQSEELYSNFKSMKGTKGLLSTLTSFLFMVFPLYYKTVYKCKDCGTEFRI